MLNLWINAVKLFMATIKRVRYNHDSASLTLYNAYLSSAGITHRQLLHIQIIRKNGICVERSLGRNMALIFWRNIVRASQMAPEINMWPSNSSPKAFYSGEPTDISPKQIPAEKWAPLMPQSVRGIQLPKYRHLMPSGYPTLLPVGLPKCTALPQIFCHSCQSSTVVTAPC